MADLMIANLLIADLITVKQFGYIRDLVVGHDWHDAPTNVSLTIKKVTRAETWADTLTAGVLRKDASAAISFLLKAKKTPVAATSTNLKPAASKWVQLTQLLDQLPVSKYAVWSDAGKHWTFVEVREQKSTKKRYLNKLLGAPGTWAWASGISVDWMISMAETLLENPTSFAVNYCEQFTRCSACDSPLSNAKSIELAMGPICRKKFKW